VSTPSFRPRLRTEQWPCRSRPTLHLPLARCLPQLPLIHAPRCSVKRVRARTPCVSAFPQGPDVRTRRPFPPPSRTLDTTTPATSLRISNRTALTSCQLLRQTVRQPQAAKCTGPRHSAASITNRYAGKATRGADAAVPFPQGPRVGEQSRARKGTDPFPVAGLNFYFSFRSHRLLAADARFPRDPQSQGTTTDLGRIVPGLASRALVLGT